MKINLSSIAASNPDKVTTITYESNTRITFAFSGATTTVTGEVDASEADTVKNIIKPVEPTPTGTVASS